MKTLAVLSALAAVAFSAPTLPEASHETHQTKPSNDVSSLATEKAASSVAFNNEALREIESTSPLQLDVSHEPSARLHLGLKKPIIIKKKLGLSHLYRSSGEEKAQADPQETCMQEVKVKLCDSTKTTTTHEAKSSIIEDADTHTMDNDVKQSIKMAKEAVENLQRDLLNMEHNPDAKMSQWKHSDSESDVQMHQEIEVARQALEQIQQNFGNLESMNLRAATLKDTEHLHDTSMKMSESQEARLVQWKEAIDNIQRNVEIAKNIEDSFKSVEHENASSDSKLPKKIDTIDKKSVLHETATISTQDNPASLRKHQEIHHNDSDMSVSASSPVEMKINPESREDPLIKKDIVATEKLEKSSAAEKNDITDTKISNGKSTESDGDAAKKAKMTALRSADELDKLEDSETALKSSEKSENMIETEPTQTTLLTKSPSKFEKDLEHMSAKKSSIEQEKSANAWKEPVDKNMLTKAAEQEKSTELDTTKFMKSVDQVEKEQKHDLNTTDDLTVMQKVHQFSIGKSVEPLKTTEHPDNQPTIKSADQVVEQSAQDKTLSHFIEPAKESSVKHEAMTMKAVKEAPIQLLGKSTDSDNGLESSAHVQMKTSDFSIPPMGKSVHLDSSVSPSTDHHILHPDSSMAPNMQSEMKAANLHILPPSGKSVQLDNLQPQMENKVVEGKSAMESNKMMQWKQMQRARGAYGLGGYGGGAGGAGSGLGGGYGANAGGMGMGASGLSGFGAANGGGHGGYGSGTASAGSNAMNMGASAGHAGDSDTGAVGVFPNAKVGGCAIPLLLSCSPSVISGRLAKSHPSGYGAPAYRMGEDFKYHFKRDTKKTNEIPTIKVKRTNPKRVEKISLDKKL